MQLDPSPSPTGNRTPSACRVYLHDALLGSALLPPATWARDQCAVVTAWLDLTLDLA